MGSLKHPRWFLACLIMAVLLVVAGLMVGPTPFNRVTVFPSEQIVVDGRVRTYRLVVPASRSSASLPLVFHFHGTGGNHELEADRTKLDQVAASQNFLLVYPAGIRGSWTPHHSDEPEVNEDNPDIRFFDALFDHLTNRLPVDRKRVYVMGMSNGGSFVNELVLARSHKIAAAVIHSAPSPPRIKCERPMPVLLVIGEDEGASFLEMARNCGREFRENGHDCELLVLKHVGHRWAPRYNLQLWRFLARHRLDGTP